MVGAGCGSGGSEWRLPAIFRACGPDCQLESCWPSVAAKMAFSGEVLSFLVNHMGDKILVFGDEKKI